MLAEPEPTAPLTVSVAVAVTETAPVTVEGQTRSAVPSAASVPGVSVHPDEVDQSQVTGFGLVAVNRTLSPVCADGTAASTVTSGGEASTGTVSRKLELAVFQLSARNVPGAGSVLK
jgi:hypothetical protein